MIHIRLSRAVARRQLACFWCRYPVVEYQPVYSPMVDGVALADYCSPRCAERNTPGELRVTYV